MREIKQYSFDKVKFDLDLNDFICSELNGLINKFRERWIIYLDPEPEFENIEEFNLFQRDLYNCIIGLEYCLSLTNNNKYITEEDKLFSLSGLYIDIFLCINLLSKHHKITNGKWVSVDSQERKKLVAKWDEYKYIENQIYNNDSFPGSIDEDEEPEKKYQIERKHVEGKNR